MDDKLNNKDLIKEDIITLLKVYLRFNSLDGKPIRQVLRKKLSEFLETLDKQ